MKIKEAFGRKHKEFSSKWGGGGREFVKGVGNLLAQWHIINIIIIIIIIIVALLFIVMREHLEQSGRKSYHQQQLHDVAFLLKVV